MKFTRDTAEIAADTVARDIQKHLEVGERVLWLTSGGSATDIQVQIMDALSSALPGNELSDLTILPVDERYGDFDHADSNGAQLGRAGFNPYPALWLDVLSENKSFTETVSFYNELTTTALNEADYIIATLGMGSDGHTAGILPNSPAVEDTESLVVGYKWTDYERMTLGLTVLSKINTAYVLCYGEAKEDALKRLQENDEPLSKLPSKLLYNIPNVTIYNDFIENEE